MRIARRCAPGQLVTDARHRDNAGTLRGLAGRDQRGEQQPGQQERPEVVGRQLLLEAVDRGLWAEPSPDVLAELKQTFLATEGDLEGA